MPTREKVGVTAIPGEESIRTIWKPEMRRNLCSGSNHQGRVDVPYRMRTTGSYSDPLDRQLQERINITSFKGPILMNRRNEMGGVRVDRMRYMRWGGN